MADIFHLDASFVDLASTGESKGGGRAVKRIFSKKVRVSWAVLDQEVRSHRSSGNMV